MEKKNNRITIRLTKAELETLHAKVSDAGYKSAGAFIRDSVASGNVKAKIGVNVVIIAMELAALTKMIKAGQPANEILGKVRVIASVNAGGIL